MATIIKYPIGIQKFEKLRNEGFLYIDKTALIMKMVQEGCYYFLSRPRRFGKSLLLSTIQAYFEGKRELFKGLAIDTDEVSWESHPVMRLDLNAQKYDSKERLDYMLNNFIAEQESKYGIVNNSDNYGPRFENVIRNAYEATGKRVVILVDEYDKPMLQAIDNKELQDEYRNTLKAFYGALKSMDGCIQFAFLTGVTKFGKVSVFSDLNHLTDLSMDPRYHDICGLTEDEIRKNFKEGVAELAEANDMTVEECMAVLKERYAGFRFNHKMPDVYNPSSIFLLLNHKDMRDYWFQTGTPSHVVRSLERRYYDFAQIDKKHMASDALYSLESSDTDIVSLLYPSGYLTIKEYEPESSLCTLDFPNEEVREAFEFLLRYVSIPADSIPSRLRCLSKRTQMLNAEQSKSPARHATSMVW